MSQFVIVAEFQVTPQDLERLVAAGREEAAAVIRAEPRCRRFDVITAVEQPGRGLFYEVFEDEAAFETHRQTPHFAAFFDAISDLNVDWQATKYELG